MEGDVAGAATGLRVDIGDLFNTRSPPGIPTMHIAVALGSELSSSISLLTDPVLVTP